jgi:hypothetical protein
MRRTWLVPGAVLWACFGIVSLPAQPPPFGGPVEGFTFDAPSKTIRAVTGLPGSAYLGAALLSGLDYASVAPRQRYAVAFQNGRVLLVTGLGLDQTSTTELPGSVAVPEGVAWSDDGSVAILYSRRDNWIQTLSGLPAAPAPGASLSLAPLGGSLSAVAVDGHGGHIAIAIGGENPGVFQVADGQNVVPLLSSSKPVAVAFSTDGGTLYALDGATRQITGISMANFASRDLFLVGLEDPVAIALAQDAAQKPLIFAAGGRDRALLSYDASSQQATASFQLAFEPTAMEPLGQDTFVLAPRMHPGQPLWSFSSAPQPRVFFIPAMPLPAEDGAR